MERYCGRSFVLVLLMWAGLAGAQTPPASKPLAAEDAAKIGGVFVVSAVPQADIKTTSEQFIRAQVINTGVRGGGGLIGALIGAAIVNSQIKKRLEEAALALPKIVDSVADFDFREELWAELDRVIKAETRFKIADSRFISGERSYFDPPESARGVPVDAVLDLNTEYALGIGMRTMIVTTTALLKLRGTEKEIYRAGYTFATAPIAATDFESAATRWSADNGALYRAAMRLAVVQTARMLQLDLLGADAPVAPAVPLKTLHMSDLDRQAGLANPELGALIEQNDDIFVTRDDKNNMRSVMRGKEFTTVLAVAPPVPRPRVTETLPSTAAPDLAREERRSEQPEPQLSMDSLRDLLPAR